MTEKPKRKTRSAKGNNAVPSDGLPMWMGRRHPGVTIMLALALLYWLAFAIGGTFSASEQRVEGVDPVGYYSWVRSLAFDHDLDFANEYRALTPPEARVPGSPVDPDGPRTATGHMPNVFAAGPGLLWSPFLLLGHLTASLGGMDRDGFSQPYHTAIFIANIIYGLAGAMLTCLALRNWFGRWTSTVAAVAAWTCSPALYYTYPQEAMSHACSFFAMSLFVYLWIRFREKDNLWHWALVGGALGLAVLVRWQNLTFAVIPAMDLLTHPKPRNILRLSLCALATCVVFAPQMIGWKVIYGSFVTIPQGPGFMGWTHPELIRLFFSGEHGLVTWTPLCGLGLIGLFLLPKENRRAYVAILVAVLLQCYVSACAGSAGWSFGMRRLVNCVPMFAVGLAIVFEKLRERRLWVLLAVGAFALWNFLFILQYGGILDNLYVNEAFEALASKHGVSVQQLVDMNRLPNGQEFDVGEFARKHRFPREQSPTFRQFVPDKLTVLIVFFLNMFQPSLE